MSDTRTPKTKVAIEGPSNAIAWRNQAFLREFCREKDRHIATGHINDSGFTPELVLEMIQRHITFTPDQLAAESLTKSVDPVKLKKDLLTLLDQTRKTLQEIPAKAIGCLFTDKKGNVLKDLSKLKLNLHNLHHGTVRGSWPKIVN